MAYATVADVQARMTRTMSADEQTMCATLLDDAAIIIDAFNASATADAKKIVSYRSNARFNVRTWLFTELDVIKRLDRRNVPVKDG